MATPWKNVMVPRVTMKGVARFVATSMPLMAPMIVPAAMPANTPTTTDPVPMIVKAVASPATESDAPTDRSSPPATRRMVWPDATMPRADTWKRMLSRLFGDRKRGLPTAVTTMMATRVSSKVKRPIHQAAKGGDPHSAWTGPGDGRGRHQCGLRGGLRLDRGEQMAGRQPRRRELLVEATPPQHDDAVGQADQFLKVGGHEDDAGPFVGEPAQVIVDLALATRRRRPGSGSSSTNSLPSAKMARPSSALRWLPPLRKRTSRLGTRGLRSRRSESAMARLGLLGRGSRTRRARGSRARRARCSLAMESGITRPRPRMSSGMNSTPRATASRTLRGA